MNSVDVEATVKKVKYYDELTDWAVIQFINNKTAKTFYATGSLGDQMPGYELVLKGRWVKSLYSRNEQLEVVDYIIKPPSTTDGIYLFLTSDLFKGLSKKAVRELVDTYGEKTLSLIDYDTSIVLSVKGVGPSNYLKFKHSYEETLPQQKKIFEILEQTKFSFKEALSIVSEFKHEPLQLLKKAPYSIFWKLKKIPFIRYDRVVMALGDFKFNSQRIREVIMHQFKASYQDKHTLLTYDQVFNGAKRYLGLDDYLIKQEIDYLIQKKRIVLDFEDGVAVLQSQWLYSIEKEIANRIAINMETPAEKELNFDPNNTQIDILKKEQKKAVCAPFYNKVSIISGKPGTGKTTLLKVLCKLLLEQNVTILGLAPTGKAAQRFSEVTGQECSTIHRALGATHLSDQFKFNDLNPLDVDVVLIDEMSMLDMFIFKSLLRAIPYTARVVLIGDVNQLPSVDLGAIFRDLINSKKIPTYWLNEVLRITRDDGLIPTPLQFADNILRGKAARPKNDDEFEFIPSDDNEQTKKILFEVINSLKNQKVSYKDIQIFTALNHKSIGVSTLNPLIKKAFYPDGDDQFELGDKIMQDTNNYDLMVFNGDVGYVTEVFKNSEGKIDDRTPVLKLDMSGREVVYTKKETKQLSLAYAMTGHKSQGSEYPYVICVLPDRFISLMDRYWFYTVITRCQKKVFVIGSTKIVREIILSMRSHLRKTGLVKQLCRFLPNLSQ